MSQADEEQDILPPEQEAELLGALQAALRPAHISAAVNERLIELALEDPLAPASEAELAESARLRDALEQGGSHEDVAALGALRHAFQEPLELESNLDRAMLQALAAPAPLRKQPQSNVVYAAFGAAGAALAAAAVAVLFLGTVSGSDPAPSAATQEGLFAMPRSTTPLFSERFETGDTTARMDAIASARSRELRGNRYAAWGVR